MVVSTSVVARRYEDVSAGVPISVDFPAYEVGDVYVYYGNAPLVAVQGTDYTVALAGDFETFTVTPTASLLTKINALIAGDPTEENYITVRRVLDYLTDATPDGVRYTPYTSREFDRNAMRDMQLAERLNRALVLSDSSVGAAPTLELREIGPNRVLTVSEGGDAVVAGPTIFEVANAEAHADAAEAIYQELLAGAYRQFASIALMAAATDVADLQYVQVQSAFNRGRETFQYRAGGTVTANGVSVVEATGMGAGRFVSTRTEFADEAELVADPRLPSSFAADPSTFVDTVFRAGTKFYEMVLSGATDYHLVTAGGVKLRFLPEQSGHVYRKWGRIGDVSALKAAVTAGSVKVAFWGDSITEGVWQVSYPDSWAGLLTRDLKAAVGGVTLSFGNFAIGGATIGDAANAAYVGAADAGSVVPGASFWRDENALTDAWPGGVTAGDSWKEHVEAYAPDVLIVAFGMNAGPENISNSNDNLTTLRSLIADQVATWAKPPTVFLVTPMQPSRTSVAASGYEYVQALADGIRDLAAELNVGLIDANARHLLLRDGVDVSRSSYRRYADFIDYDDWLTVAGTRPTLASGTLTFGAGTNVVHRLITARDVQISGTVALASGDLMGIRYRRHVDNPNYGYELHINNTGGNTSWQLYYSDSNSTTALDSGDIADVTSVDFSLEIVGTRHKITLNGVVVCNSHFRHWLRAGYYGLFAVNGAAVTDFVALMGRPAVTAHPVYGEFELLGAVNDFDSNPDSLGGNPDNHPSILGHRALYRAACEPFFDAMQTASLTAVPEVVKVAFSVSATVSFTTGETISNYAARDNLGGAMNAVTGVFTAPAAGRYKFSWAVVNSTAAVCYSTLRVNGTPTLTANTTATPGSQTGNAGILSLAEGDEIDLHILGGTTSSDPGLNHFMGEQL